MGNSDSCSLPFAVALATSVVMLGRAAGGGHGCRPAIQGPACSAGASRDLLMVGHAGYGFDVLAAHFDSQDVGRFLKKVMLTVGDARGSLGEFTEDLGSYDPDALGALTGIPCGCTNC